MTKTKQKLNKESMKSKKTLEQLISEVMEELKPRVLKPTRKEEERFWEVKSMLVEELWQEMKEPLRQSLIKIAKATAEVGRMKPIKEKDKIPLPRVRQYMFSTDRQDGFNQAVQEQQQKLKEFLGDVSD
jgi:hypothetical protein